MCSNTVIMAQTKPLENTVVRKRIVPYVKILTADSQKHIRSNLDLSTWSQECMFNHLAWIHDLYLGY